MQGQEQQSKNETIYLFLSQNCQHSIQLIKEIQKKPELSKLVQAVPVENTPNIPPQVTKVPSILKDGKVMTGNECFEWVEKYGEIETSPTFTNSGFEADSYSYLDGAAGGDAGSESFSFLGAQNGSVGVDSNKADNAHQYEQSQRQQNSPGNVNMNMDSLQQQRDMDINNLQGGQQRGSPPNGMRIY